jgi:hypothetical protein
VLEMICQQRYRELGIPVDVSPYRNHGAAAGTTAAAGPAPGRGAIHFGTPASRVAIPLGEWGAWAPLVALKVEVDVRLDPAAARTQVLVAGEGSFQFAIEELAPAAVVTGPGGTQMYVRADGTFSPDGQLHKVPANQWVTLGLEHDGYARMLLRIDGVVVGQTIVNAGVPGVTGAGVSVGNAAGGNVPIHGDLEELRVWRYDPRAMKRDFLGRPYSEETAHCWEDLFRALFQWMRDHPADADSLVRLLDAQRRALLHGLGLLPPAELDHLRKLGRHYENLWRQGRLGGREMTDVFVGFIRVVRAHGLDPTADPRWGELKALLRRIHLELPEADLDCDPEIRGLEKAIRRAEREAR